MIRLLGLALLAAGGALLGRSHARRLWERAGTLYALAGATEDLLAGMEARKSLAMLCRELSRTENVCGAFFRELAAGTDMDSGTEGLWKNLAEAQFAPLLTARELEPFLAAGRALHSAAGVPRALDQSARRLRELARQAEDAALRDGRLWTMLGLLGGLMGGIGLI